jgi:hypothetical protein
MVPKIGDGEARFWDLLLKAFGGLIAITTVMVGWQTLRIQGVKGSAKAIVKSAKPIRSDH